MKPLQLIRFGAYGDLIMSSAIIPFLQDRYNPIALETNLKGVELFVNDPRFINVSCFSPESYPEDVRYARCVDRWNRLEEHCNKQDVKCLNLWSSVENSCLLYEYNEDTLLSRKQIEEKYNNNFYEKIFEKAELEIPEGWIHRNTLYFEPHDEEVVDRWKEKNKEYFVMLVALGGSSRQKVFPTWMKDYCCNLVDMYPKLKIYLMGGPELGNDIWKYDRTFSYVCGTNDINLSFRQSLLMARKANYILGGETGLMVGAGMFGTPKTILFTLANKNQMVGYHENDYSVQSKASCSPCYVMAYNGERCQKEPVYNAFPICTHEFDLGELSRVFDKLYTSKF